MALRPLRHHRSHPDADSRDGQRTPGAFPALSQYAASDPCCDILSLAERLSGHQNRKLLPTIPGKKIPRPDTIAYAVCDGSKGKVAHEVAITIIEALEV